MLERKEITPMELKIADELKDDYFGVESSFDKQIIDFFKNHDFNYEYFIQQADDIGFRNIYIGNDDAYRKYHINMSANSSFFEIERYRVVIITEEQFKLPKDEFLNLTREIVNPNTKHPMVTQPFIQTDDLIDKIGMCVVEMYPEEQYNYISSLKSQGIDTSYYDSFYSEFKVINKSRAVITQSDLIGTMLNENVDMRDKELLNFVQVCEEHGVTDLDDSDQSLAKVKKLIAALTERNKKSAKGIALYYSDSHLAPGMKNYSIRKDATIYRDKLYCLCAMYLKFYEDIPCCIDSIINDNWEAMSGYIKSPDNNYIEDYLQFLANPTEVGFTVKAGYNYYLYKKTKLQKFNITFAATKVVCTDFSYGEAELATMGCTDSDDYIKNLKTLRLFDEDILDFIVSYNQIKVIPLREYYRINTNNFNFSHSELKRLDNLIWQFTKLMKDSFLNTALDCSNLLLFEFRGELYLGVCCSIDYKCGYQCIPVNNVYRETPYSGEMVSLSPAEMSALLDVRLFNDYKLLIGNMKLNNFEMFRHTFMSQLVNFLFSSSNKSITGLSQMTYDEATILYQITKDLRGVGANTLTKGGLTIANLKYNFLTYFGGPTAYERHASGNTDARIELEITREMFQ